MDHPQTDPNPNPPTKRHKGLPRVYGKLPSRGDLLHHQLEGRKYFDSGDFALSQARRPSNIGTIKTGPEHPVREKISHPLSPVPSSSNVGENANQGMQSEKNTGEMKHTSHLHQEVGSKNGNSQDSSEEVKQKKEGLDTGVCDTASQLSA